MERREDPRRRTGQNPSRGRVPQSGYQGPRAEQRSRSRSASESRSASGRPPKRPQGSQNSRRNHATARSRRKRKRLIRRLVFAFFALILVCVIGIGAYGMRLFSTMGRIDGLNLKDLQNTNLSSDTIQNMKKYWTIAAFGVDAREGEGLGKGVRSDVIMICNIEQKTGDIKLLSIYRDTYSKITDKKYGKLNEAYAQGGPEQAIQALNQNFDLQIDDYITVNWKAVIDAINILGGIDLEITDREFKYINSFITETVNETGVGSHQLTSAGMQHLDGVQAVAYSRLRLMDTDFQRTERQRKVLQLCMDKAKNADFSVLNNVLVTVLGQTVSSFEINDLARAAQNILNYNIVETSGFPFELKDTYIGKQDCVVPTTLASNVSQLHSFLFGIENYTPSTSVQNISDAIVQKVGSGGGSKVTATTGSSQKSTTAATSEAARTTEAEREEESEEELEASSEGLEEEESTSLEENEASTEENEEEESRLSESESESSRPFESESSNSRPRETSTAASSSAAENETERPRETTSNIFTEKPSYEVQEEQPEGPGKIGGNAGVSAPGETLPLS